MKKFSYLFFLLSFLLKPNESLAVLKASELYTGEYLTDKTEGEIQAIVKRGLSLKIEKKEKEATEVLEQGALYGSPIAMVHLGHLHFESGKILNHEIEQMEGVRWYMLAFQTHWERTGRYLTSAWQPLILGLNKEFWDYYPQFDPESHEKIFCFHQMKEVYSSDNPVETDLTLEEKKAKAARYARLITQISLDVNKPKDIKTKKTDCNFIITCYLSGWETLGECYNEGILGVSLDKTERIKAAATAFEKAGTEKSHYKLGVLYFLGELGEELLLEERANRAAEFFRMVNTPEAKETLGVLYSEGKIGKDLSEDERCERAAKLYEESNLPTAKFNLGAMYEKRKIGKSLPDEERIQRAVEFYCASNILAARYNLGVMYRRKIIGKNLSDKIRYKKAAEYYKGLDRSDAKLNLGYLYLYELIDETLSQQTKYAKAAELFKEANLPESKHNIGVLYLKGYKPRAEISPEEQRKSAAKSFEEAAFPPSQYALAYLILNFPEEIEPGMQTLEFCEKASQLLTKAQLDGIEDTLNLQEKIEALVGKTIVDTPKLKIQEEEHGKAIVSVISENVLKEENKQSKSEKIKFSKKKKNQDKKRRKLEILTEFLSKRGGALVDPSNAPDKKEVLLEKIGFLSEEVKENVEQAMGSHKKMPELMEDILYKPWGTDGAGKPELLKYGIYKGCYSRRITGEKRIIYRVASGKVEILFCGGHYE